MVVFGASSGSFARFFLRGLAPVPALFGNLLLENVAVREVARSPTGTAKAIFKREKKRKKCQTLFIRRFSLAIDIEKNCRKREMYIYVQQAKIIGKWVNWIR